MKILILCTGNTCRSPMAEGIARQMIKQHNLTDIEVQSMGFAALEGDMPTAHAITAMGEISIDIKRKTSSRVNKQDLIDADLIYVMTDSHKNILLDLDPALETVLTVLDIPDPYSRDLEVYRTCRETMVLFFKAELPRWRELANGK